MKTELREGRLYLHRETEERAPLLKRLARIEGQVRGLHDMIASDRYCGDELQLAAAILAAMREVMRMLAAQHIDAGFDHLSAHPKRRSELAADIAAVLRPLLRER